MKQGIAINPLLLTILSSVVVLGAVAYGYMAVIGPINNKINKNQQQAQLMMQQVNLKSKQKENTKKIDVDQLIRQLPGTKRIDNYMMVLRQQANQTNNVIKSINISDRQKGSTTKSKASDIKSIPFDLNVEAPDFTSMKVFINKLEQLTRITHVVALHFQAPQIIIGKNQTNQVVNFQISLLIYYDPKAKELDHGQGLLPFGVPGNKTSPF